jgi:hypothetical protein
MSREDLARHNEFAKVALHEQSKKFNLSQTRLVHAVELNGLSPISFVLQVNPSGSQRGWRISYI